MSHGRRRRRRAPSVCSSARVHLKQHGPARHRAGDQRRVERDVVGAVVAVAARAHDVDRRGSRSGSRPRAAASAARRTNAPCVRLQTSSAPSLHTRQRRRRADRAVHQERPRVTSPRRPCAPRGRARAAGRRRRPGMPSTTRKSAAGCSSSQSRQRASGSGSSASSRQRAPALQRVARAQPPAPRARPRRRGSRRRGRPPRRPGPPGRAPVHGLQRARPGSAAERRARAACPGSAQVADERAAPVTSPAMSSRAPRRPTMR